MVHLNQFHFGLVQLNSCTHQFNREGFLSTETRKFISPDLASVCIYQLVPRMFDQPRFHFFVDAPKLCWANSFLYC